MQIHVQEYRKKAKEATSLGKPGTGWVGDGKRPTSYMSKEQVLSLLSMRELDDNDNLEVYERRVVGPDGTEYGNHPWFQELATAIAGTTKDSPYPFKEKKDFKEPDYAHRARKLSKVVNEMKV